jgi:hypothetical protein
VSFAAMTLCVASQGVFIIVVVDVIIIVAARYRLSPETYVYTLVLQKWIRFQTLGLTKLLMCSVDVNMGTIRVMTHRQTIFSIWTGTDKHFISVALCSSECSDTQLTFEIFHYKQCLLQIEVFWVVTQCSVEDGSTMKL